MRVQNDVADCAAGIGDGIERAAGGRSQTKHGRRRRARDPCHIGVGDASGHAAIGECGNLAQRAQRRQVIATVERFIEVGRADQHAGRSDGIEDVGRNELSGGVDCGKRLSAGAGDDQADDLGERGEKRQHDAPIEVFQLLADGVMDRIGSGASRAADCNDLVLGDAAVAFRKRILPPDQFAGMVLRRRAGILRAAEDRAIERIKSDRIQLRDRQVADHREPLPRMEGNMPRSYPETSGSLTSAMAPAKNSLKPLRRKAFRPGTRRKQRQRQCWRCS